MELDSSYRIHKRRPANFSRFEGKNAIQNLTKIFIYKNKNLLTTTNNLLKIFVL
jgi:hypothetical protein